MLLRLLDLRGRQRCVLAHDAKECGPAALSTVARHYGLYLSLARVRDLCGTDQQGSDLNRLRRAAELLGFSASCGKSRTRALGQLPLPAILHLDQSAGGHFVVLREVSDKLAVLADPSVGIVRLSHEGLLERWTGYAVLLAPSNRFRRSPHPDAGIRELAKIALRERKALVVSVCLALVITLLALAPSFCFKVALDRVIPNSSFRMLYAVGIGMVCIVVFYSLAVLGREYVLAYTGQKLEASIGSRYVQHVLSLPLDFFDGRHPGDILDRLYDATFIRRAVTNSLLTVLLDGALLLASTALLASYSLELTAVAWCAILAVGALAFLSISPLSRRQRETRQRSSQLASRFVDTVMNMRVVKVFAGEPEAYRKISKTYGEFCRATFDIERLSARLGSAATFLAGSASAVVLVVGSRLVIDGGATVGELVLFYSILGFFLGTVQHIGPSLTSIREGTVGIERLNEIQLSEAEGSGKAGEVLGDNPGGAIEFRDVWFWYREGLPVLVDINIKVGAGETLAFLGETGSGKTTLACLISGLYSPRMGAVLLDGKPICDLDKASLRGHLAVVFQEGGLLNGTIRENIAMGTPGATDDEVREAAGKARAADFILGLPNGYTYTIGSQGTGLSSGQRQRIAIARALLRNPSVMILDEATSNLDTETEREVMDSLMEARKGRTTIIITHRLSTAVRADRIVVLGNGRILESGTHRELLQKRGKYFSMWSALPAASADFAHATAS